MGRGLETDLSVAYLDTHVALWLYAGASENLTVEAKRQIELNDLLISPMVLLELEYLHESKKLNPAAKQMLTDLHVELGLRVCQFSFAAIAAEAEHCKWTRDPFDRIIVSHAKANGEAVLITSDRKIRQHYPAARW